MQFCFSLFYRIEAGLFSSGGQGLKIGAVFCFIYTFGFGGLSNRKCGREKKKDLGYYKKRFAHLGNTYEKKKRLDKAGKLNKLPAKARNIPAAVINSLCSQASASRTDSPLD